MPRSEPMITLPTTAQRNAWLDSLSRDELNAYNEIYPHFKITHHNKPGTSDAVNRSYSTVATQLSHGVFSGRTYEVVPHMISQCEDESKASQSTQSAQSSNTGPRHQPKTDQDPNTSKPDSTAGGQGGGK